MGTGGIWYVENIQIIESRQCHENYCNITVFINPMNLLFRADMPSKVYQSFTPYPQRSICMLIPLGVQTQ